MYAHKVASKGLIMAEPNVFQQFLLDVFPGTPQATKFAQSKSQQGVLEARNAFVQEVARATSTGIALPRAINDAIRSPAGIELLSRDKEALESPEKLLEILKPAQEAVVTSGQMGAAQFKGLPPEKQEAFHGIGPGDQEMPSVSEVIKLVASGVKVPPETFKTLGMPAITKEQANTAVLLGSSNDPRAPTELDLTMRAFGQETGTALDNTEPETALAALRVRIESRKQAADNWMNIMMGMMGKQLGAQGALPGGGDKKTEDIGSIIQGDVQRQAKAKPKAAPKADPTVPKVTASKGEGGQTAPLVGAPPQTVEQVAAMTIEEIKALGAQIQSGQLPLASLPPEVGRALEARFASGQ